LFHSLFQFVESLVFNGLYMSVIKEEARQQLPDAVLRFLNDGYKKLEKVGEGSFGVVWKGVDTVSELSRDKRGSGG
jgi:hypothetical protein